MKLTIEIPREFEREFKNDAFEEFFSRVSEDIKHREVVLCGQYEKETADMLLEAFGDAYIEED